MQIGHCLDGVIASMKNKFHHYISQLYLKKFAHTDGARPRLYMYDKVQEKEQPRALISRNAGEDYFNLCFGPDPMAIEHFYARKIETPSGAALKRILEARSLEVSHDLCDILLFFAMTSARNPKYREQIEDPLRQLDLMILKTALGDNATDAMAARSRRNLTSKEHVAMELGLIDPLHEAFCRKGWALLSAPSCSGGFITSDDPMQIVRASSPGNWGYNTEGAELFAPLSPRLALLGGEGARKKKAVTLTAEQVGHFNTGTILDAHKYIFAKSDEFNVISNDGLTTWRSCLSSKS